MIPTKGQLVAESVIGGIRSIIEPIVGKKVFFASFGLLSGLFFFILIHNWSGLLPGVGTVGYGSIVDDHFIGVAAVARDGAESLVTFGGMAPRK